jgi:hypothetical protein
MTRAARAAHRSIDVALAFALAALAGCSGGAPSSSGPADAAPPPPVDAAPPPSARGLGEVTGVEPAGCPGGLPAGATCSHVTVRSCPDLESEALGATIVALPPAGAATGTIVHFKGGGGEGLENLGLADYRAAGFQQVFVSWDADWEQTASHGILAAACRPATVLRWIFAKHHASSRALPFCAQGKSGGSGQLGYALSHYGQADILDFVSELAGPPFSRIDLGCDGDAPATAELCGATVTMRLPDKLTGWENMPPPLRCGDRAVPAGELARWRADSIAFGGSYAYPRTRVAFFDCTNNAPAVAAMSKLLYDQLAATGVTDASHTCFGVAEGCQGEGLGTGEAVAIQAMLDGCTPRHR